MAVANTLEAIKSLLHPHKFQLSNDGKLSIKEADRKATLRSVQVDSVGASAFSIHYDQCKFPGELLFAPHKTLHRACDAIAFCEVGGDPFIMCFELKSSEPARSEVAEQFRSAHCFLDYLATLLENYCTCDTIREWPRRYFVFHNQDALPMTKRASRDEFDNDSPERASFIPIQTGEKLYLRKLLGRAA
jgi:hypothetical protein